MGEPILCHAKMPARDYRGCLLPEAHAGECFEAERDAERAARERAEAVLREFADEANWQDCLWCDGSGIDRQDHKHRMRCTVCQGRLKTFYDDAADEKSGGILGRARAALSRKEGST